MIGWAFEHPIDFNCISPLRQLTQKALIDRSGRIESFTSMGKEKATPRFFDVALECLWLVQPSHLPVTDFGDGRVIELIGKNHR
jgi:hypothetical protein